MKTFSSLNKGAAPDSILESGKYRGCKLKYVLDMEPEYIEWLIKYRSFRVNQESRAMLNSVLAKQKALEYYKQEVEPYLKEYDDYSELCFED